MDSEYFNAPQKFLSNKIYRHLRSISKKLRSKLISLECASDFLSNLNTKIMIFQSFKNLRTCNKENFIMSRIFSFALYLSVMFFIILFLYELIESNMEMTKFYALCENVKNNKLSVNSLFSMSLSDWVEVFLKTPRFFLEYESRYNCDVINIPSYEKLIESLSRLIGYEYTAFDPWRHCSVYDHEIKAFNPDYGKLVMPDYVNVSLISLTLTTAIFLYMLYQATDWLVEKGAYLFNRIGMVKEHVCRDGVNIYRAISRGLLGMQDRFTELHPSLGRSFCREENVPTRPETQDGDANPILLEVAYWQLVTDFGLCFELPKKLRRPIFFYMDSYKAQICIEEPGSERPRGVNINLEEDGYYTALVPYRSARMQYILLECICIPYRLVCRLGRSF